MSKPRKRTAKHHPQSQKSVVPFIPKHEGEELSQMVRRISNKIENGDIPESAGNTVAKLAMIEIKDFINKLKHAELALKIQQFEHRTALPKPSRVTPRDSAVKTRICELEAELAELKAAEKKAA